MRRFEYYNFKVDEIRLALDCIFYAWQSSQISDSELFKLENFFEDISVELYGADSVNGTISELKE